MGAHIQYLGAEGRAPFTITGGNLTGRTHHLPVASAQVQTSILLAGLQAEGRTSVMVPLPVRDHTARMFRHIGVPHEANNLSIAVDRLERPLRPFSLKVPADISSAAFFMVAASCLPGSEIELTGVGINPGRRLVIDALARMGADIEERNQRVICQEPVADLLVRGSGRLSGTTITAEEVSSGIDEIPALAVAGSLCQGQFEVTGASELRVKESDRIKALVENLRAAGAAVQELPDGLKIEGSPLLTGGSLWQSYQDHRLAMAGFIAGFLSNNPIKIDDCHCIAISYPSFLRDLMLLRA